MLWRKDTFPSNTKNARGRLPGVFSLCACVLGEVSGRVPPLAERAAHPGEGGKGAQLLAAAGDGVEGEGDDLVLLLGFHRHGLVAPLAGSGGGFLLPVLLASLPLEFVKLLDVFLDQGQELLQIEGTQLPIGQVPLRWHAHADPPFRNPGQRRSGRSE
jgi:hypothetical protein